MPPRLLTEALDHLSTAGFVTQCATDPITYQPARPLESIRVGDISSILRETGDEPSQFRKDEIYKPIFDELNNSRAPFADRTIEDLANSVKLPDDAATTD